MSSTGKPKQIWTGQIVKVISKVKNKVKSLPRTANTKVLIT